jgi:hypothetical protein
MLHKRKSRRNNKHYRWCLTGNALSVVAVRLIDDA